MLPFPGGLNDLRMGIFLILNKSHFWIFNEKEHVTILENAKLVTEE